jgi:hypothetical protein
MIIPFFGIVIMILSLVYHFVNLRIFFKNETVVCPFLLTSLVKIRISG